MLLIVYRWLISAADALLSLTPAAQGRVGLVMVGTSGLCSYAEVP